MLYEKNYFSHTNRGAAMYKSEFMLRSTFIAIAVFMWWNGPDVNHRPAHMHNGQEAAATQSTAGPTSLPSEGVGFPGVVINDPYTRR